MNRALRPTLLLVTCFAVLLGSCGSAELSLSEYVDRINAVTDQASRRGRELIALEDQSDDVTPQDVQAVLGRAREIRVEIKQTTDGIEPPAQIADLHNLIFDWHTEFISVEETLAARAGQAADTAEDWAMLSDSTEMVAYRDSIIEGKEICDTFQARLDATAERGVFAETPWIPDELAEVVEAVLGCEWFPEYPEDLYRYPPSP